MVVNSGVCGRFLPGTRRGIIGTCPSPRSRWTICAVAIARTFFTPTTLPRAITKLGFVQADPIRAGARRI